MQDHQIHVMCHNRYLKLKLLTFHDNKIKNGCIKKTFRYHKIY